MSLSNGSTMTYDLNEMFRGHVPIKRDKKDILVNGKVGEGSSGRFAASCDPAW